MCLSPNHHALGHPNLRDGASHRLSARCHEFLNKCEVDEVLNGTEGTNSRKPSKFRNYSDVIMCFNY